MSRAKVSWVSGCLRRSRAEFYDIRRSYCEDRVALVTFCEVMDTHTSHSTSLFSMIQSRWKSSHLIFLLIVFVCLYHARL